MLKLFKIKIQDHIDEDDNPQIRTEFIAANRLQDIYNIEDNILKVEQLQPFKVIE
jgi:hypothetical protein